MPIRFTTILRDLILENSRFQVLFDKFVKPKEKGKKGIIPFETLFSIIAADPTTRIPDGLNTDNVKPQDMERVKIGSYTQWILKNFVTPTLPADHPINILDPQSGQYKNAIKEFQNLYLEDLYKITGDLKKFDRFKSRLDQQYRDINKLTPETLYNQVKDFSLEKTKATKDEKKEASTTYKHPGAEIVYRGQNWTIAKISDTGQLGKDAACFYGGSHNEPIKGETRWCTSSPGLNYWKSYLSKGPLYVVIPNSPTPFKGYGKEVGDISGLPANRYQFHFQDKQFMDADDWQIDLVEFFKKNEDLKTYFKPEFMKSIAGEKGDKVVIDYPSDSSSKFMALYGFDEFFDTLPQNLKRFTFRNTSKSGDNINLSLPSDIGRFKELQALNLIGCVSSIPDEICSLTNLQYLSLVDNKNLQKLPECLGDMPNLMVLNMPGAGNQNIIPDSILRKAEEDEDFNLFT